MPNEYTNQVIIFPACTEDGEPIPVLERLTELEWDARPLHRVVPTPAHILVQARANKTSEHHYAEPEYSWDVENRGTKWDAYGVSFGGMTGDSGAVRIEFCTAWSAPNQRTRDAVVSELQARFGAGRVVWIGLDPCDDSFHMLGEWEEA